MMRNRGPERVLFFFLKFHFLDSYYFFLSWFYCHWFPEMQGLPILVVVVVFFFCRFQIFCISLLLISNSSVLWGLFSSGLSLCDDFRKKMSFLLPCISGLIKAQHSQGDDKSPLFVSMVFRLVVVFIINNSQSRSWTCWARHINFVNGFVSFRLSYFD